MRGALLGDLYGMIGCFGISGRFAGSTSGVAMVSIGYKNPNSV